MEQQRELVEKALRDREVRAALDKVYGPPEPGAATMPPAYCIPPAIDIPRLLKDEQALLKTQLRLAALESKLQPNW